MSPKSLKSCLTACNVNCQPNRFTFCKLQTSKDKEAGAIGGTGGRQEVQKGIKFIESKIKLPIPFFWVSKNQRIKVTQ